ncbi:hypothetical protein G6F38_013353 [Rhizopus arrhizus]|nr:hypothetical protein G6F38_013353 [Rhizopus arrhizus]
MACLKFNAIHPLCYAYPFARFSRKSLMVIGYEVLTASNHRQDTILHTISHSKGYGLCWRQTHHLILDYQPDYYEIYKIVPSN